MPERELAFAIGDLAPDERKAMAAIAETADVLDVEGRLWLLVEASPWLLDILAAFGAEAEDRELCMVDEIESDGNSNDDLEPEGDGAPLPGAAKSREAFLRAARLRHALPRPIRVVSLEGIEGVFMPMK